MLSSKSQQGIIITNMKTDMIEQFAGVKERFEESDVKYQSFEEKHAQVLKIIQDQNDRIERVLLLQGSLLGKMSDVEDALSSEIRPSIADILGQLQEIRGLVEESSSVSENETNDDTNTMTDKLPDIAPEMISLPMKDEVNDMTLMINHEPVDEVFVPLASPRTHHHHHVGSPHHDVKHHVKQLQRELEGLGEKLSLYKSDLETFKLIVGGDVMRIDGYLSKHVDPTVEPSIEDIMQLASLVEDTVSQSFLVCVKLNALAVS